MNKTAIKFTSAALLLVVVFLCAPLCAEAKSKKAYKVSAKSAIFSNSTRAIRYYGKNVHRRVLPASTTKIMTALLVLERLPLDRVVTFSKKATLPQPSKIFAKQGQQFTVKDLLYAIMLKSANDASVALAEAVAGSEKNFVRKMNQRAKALGAVDTQFANPHGLPSPKGTQYTSAYDMYLIFRAAIKHSFFKELVQTKRQQINSLGGTRYWLKSHNKILFFKEWTRKLYGKTGYTRAAGPCFVGYLERGKSKDMCILAVLGANRRWDDIRYIVKKYGGIKI